MHHWGALFYQKMARTFGTERISCSKGAVYTVKRPIAQKIRYLLVYSFFSEYYCSVGLRSAARKNNFQTKWKPSPIAQSLAYRTREQGVAGSIPGFDENSFLGLMIVIAIGFIPLSPLSIVSGKGYTGKQPVAWKQYCAEYWQKEFSMGRYTGRRDITKYCWKNVVKHYTTNFYC